MTGLIATTLRVRHKVQDVLRETGGLMAWGRPHRAKSGGAFCHGTGLLVMSVLLIAMRLVPGFENREADYFPLLDPSFLPQLVDHWGARASLKSSPSCSRLERASLCMRLWICFLTV